jgi:hypothetical protein
MNISKITIEGNAAGLVSTGIALGIFLLGLPPTRWFLAASLTLGIIVALILRRTAPKRDQPMQKCGSGGPRSTHGAA